MFIVKAFDITSGEGCEEMKLKMKEHGFVLPLEHGDLHVAPDEQHGFRPYQLMVASVAGCSASVLRKVLTKMRLDFTEIDVAVQVTRNEEEANRIETLHLHFIIKGNELQTEKVERAVALARKNCAMLQSIKDSVQVTESIELVY